MNREIKFRGKDLLKNKWVYGYLSEIFGKDSRRFTIDEAIHFDADGNSLNVFEVYPETVGQFTGFYDKNDKEIYDGDVLKSNYEDYIYWVKYENGGFYIYNDMGRYGSIKRAFEVYKECEMQVEIIGNIYDNPELLEK